MEDNDISKLLECPVCYDRLEPTVDTCFNGHGTCKKCRKTVELCPVCKAKFPQVKNALLDQLLFSVPMSCKIKNSGCTEEKMLLEKLRIHEQTCDFRYAECNICKVKEKFICHELSKHLKDHPNKSHHTSLLVWDTLTVGSLEKKESTGSYIYYVSEIESYFMFRRYVNYKKMVAFICVQHIGKAIEANQYIYDIRINQLQRKSESSENESLFTFSGFCTPYIENMDDIRKDPTAFEFNMRSIFLANETEPFKFDIQVRVKKFVDA